MVGKDAFIVEGLVIEACPNRTWRVELANGHQLLAFLAGRDKTSAAAYVSGEKVKLQLTPYDLSVGRIITETKKDLENESSRVGKKIV